MTKKYIAMLIFQNKTSKIKTRLIEVQVQVSVESLKLKIMKTFGNFKELIARDFNEEIIFQFGVEHW